MGGSPQIAIVMGNFENAMQAVSNRTGRNVSSSRRKFMTEYVCMGKNGLDGR
jgi:hypothetical protein